MSRLVLDLRPIKDFAPSEKANLPVSIALQPDGTSFVVSRYADDVWDFYPYIPQENLEPANKMIRWRIQLPDGRLLTDSEHASLLESTKTFIWSLFTQPVEGRQRPTMLTLVWKVKDIVPLLRWMVNTGLHRFADLAEHGLSYVPAAKLRRDGCKLAEKRVNSRLCVVEDIYLQREKLNDALQVHPWPHESAASLAGLRQGGAHHKPKTNPIPDAVVVRLAEVSLDYIHSRAPRILATQEAVGAVMLEKRNAGLDADAARIRVARRAEFAGLADLRAEGNRLRTACYIVIDLFSGLRDSEMMSLGENCIALGKSRDGSLDVLWLHGTIYKTGVRTKKWLVPPVVSEAISVLSRLTAPFREALRQEEREIEAQIEAAISTEKKRLVKRINVVGKHKNKLFLGKKDSSISVLSGSRMRDHLNRFCADSNILGEDGQPYPLSSHQFRRTYARFMARAELGDLLTLRDHFGHWSIDMTTFYADGGADEYEADTELLEMVAEEKLSRQNEIMEGYLDSDAPLANGGHWLKDWRSTVRTATNKEALIAEYAGTITLNGTGHSWCIGNARGAGCGGLCVFEAKMCVDCNYGIIGQEHRPVWRGIREQQLEALALDDMGPGGRARAQQILEYAEKVLRRLDGQEDV